MSADWRYSSRRVANGFGLDRLPGRLGHEFAARVGDGGGERENQSDGE